MFIQRSRIQHFFKFIFITLVTAFLIACTDAPKEPLKLTSSPWPGYEPLYLARDLGYFNDSKVSIFELPSSDITLESFRNHSTDLATLTLDEAISLANDGIKFRILLVLDISHGGDAALAKPEIQKLEDIKDKRISIVNIPLGLYVLTRLLDHAGLERNDVDVFPMSETKQLDFYQQGKADVVITFEPVKTQLQQAGAQVIFDSRKIPNEIFDLLLVHEDVYLQRSDELCGLVDGWFKALDYIHTNPDDAAQRITKRLGMDTKDFKGMMDGIILPTPDENKRILGGNKPEILTPAAKLVEIMRNEKMIQQVNINQILAPEFASCFEHE